MKLLTGFWMAWGNFLALPCPCKKWDNDMKNAMLGFLPLTGLIIGAVWAGLCVLFVMLGLPYLVISFLVTFSLFALYGFIHLDGFMDCCDAIMSRRPVEEKQKILKDSHCGAFAVISLAFMLLAYYAFISTALSFGIDFVDLCMIPVSAAVWRVLMYCFKNRSDTASTLRGKVLLILPRKNGRPRLSLFSS